MTVTRTTTDVRVARAALSGLVEPGHREVADLLRSNGPVAGLERLLAGAVSAGLASAVRARVAVADPVTVAEQGLRRCDRLGGRLVIPEDDEWPQSLEDLQEIATGDEPHVHPPLCLWARGGHRLDTVTQRAVSIVGARAATSYGTHVASELAYGLADRGWTVVSGGAYGVDGAAHRGALTAGGVTIAVLACGVDTAYPVGHTSLFERIAADGLLISEWPPGANPQRHRFLVRNRVIAALSAGTVVVEAGARSGSRMTARRADELGRVVMAVPGPITSAMSVGSHELVRQFGAALVASSAHVLEEIGRIGEGLAEWPGRGAPGGDRRDDLDPRAARVLDAVPARMAASVDHIAAECGLSTRDVRRSIPTLVLLDFAEESEGGFRLSESARRDLARREPAARPALR